MNKTNLLTKLLLLCLCVVGSVNVWGAASTTTDGKYASGTIDFSTIGTLATATTYWHNGVKFYSGNSQSISAANTGWSEKVDLPAYISEKTFGKDTGKGKWGSNGSGKQYISSGFACNQHAIGIHVNSACTITIIVNKNISSDTDDANIAASLDATAYGTAWDGTTYKAAGTALTVTSTRADKTNYPGRYTLTINVTAGNLTDGEAVVKLFNSSSGSGAGKLFCWESITVTLPTPSLTGAWKISSTDVTGETANVVQGSSPAPTMPTFTVGATSGDPAASDYTVEYSETGISGIFTYTDGVPTGISTTTAGSATVTATLTTNDDSKFKTPATNTFTYTVTVSEASAPTDLSVTGIPASSVVQGNEVTLTASASGNPTPTYEWFKCDNADKDYPVSQGTGASLSPSTSEAGTFYYYVVASNGISPDATSDVITITVILPQLASPTVSPATGTNFISRRTVKVTDPVDGASYKYSTNNGDTWSDLSASGVSINATTTIKVKGLKDGYRESEIVSVTITKLDITLDTQTEVSSPATWDWTKFGTAEIRLTDNTAPYKDEEFVLSNLKKTELGSKTIDNDFGDPQALKVTCEYPVRGYNGTGNGYFQGPYVKFYTTIPGKIYVKYSNTGNNPKRYLNVNGTNYGAGTANSTMITTNDVQVSAGEVVITGATVENEVAVPGKYLRIEKIVFTPTPGPSDPVEEGNTVTLTTTDNMAGWRAYYNADYNYSAADANTKVYVAASDPKGDVITLTRIAGVPAGVPVILHKTGDEDDNTTITLTKEEAGTYTYGGTNKLAVTNGTDAINNVYRLGYKAGEGYGVGFYPYSGTPAAGTVYLNVSSAEARALTIAFDEDGETTAIKAIDNEQLTIDNYYDLQGRKVAQPQKGLYIVNGKKVIVK